MSVEHHVRIQRICADDLPAASAIACEAARRGAALIAIADRRGGAAQVTVAWPTRCSEAVTWEACPHCGVDAAVGRGRAGVLLDAVEFDCPNGCCLGVQELIRHFPPRDGGWIAGS